MIHIKSDLWKIPLYLKGISQKVIKRATARSVNETARNLTKNVSMEIRKRYKLPAGGTSEGGGGRRPPGVKSMISVTKARNPGRSTPLASIFATIGTSKKPISLIHFVKGAKVAPRQAGIPVNKRKPVKVQINPGRTVTLPRAFIQEARGSVQVFRRGKGGKLIKQSIPAINMVLRKEAVRDRIYKEAREIYQRRLMHNINYYMGTIPHPKGSPR